MVVARADSQRHRLAGFPLPLSGKTGSPRAESRASRRAPAYRQIDVFAEEFPGTCDHHGAVVRARATCGLLEGRIGLRNDSPDPIPAETGEARRQACHRGLPTHLPGDRRSDAARPEAIPVRTKASPWPGTCDTGPDMDAWRTALSSFRWRSQECRSKQWSMMMIQRAVSTACTWNR